MYTLSSLYLQEARNQLIQRFSQRVALEVSNANCLEIFRYLFLIKTFSRGQYYFCVIIISNNTNKAKSFSKNERNKE